MPCRVALVSPPYFMRIVPWTTSSSASRPTLPSLGAPPIDTLATSRTRTGMPFCSTTTTSSMSFREPIKPIPRMV